MRAERRAAASCYSRAGHSGQAQVTPHRLKSQVGARHLKDSKRQEAGFSSCVTTEL